MKHRTAVLLAFLLSGASFGGAAAPPVQTLPPGGESVACLDADRSGCGILIIKGVNEEGYYLKVETAARAADAVRIGLRGRFIVISRSEFRRSERTSDRGAFGLFSRSSRFATRLRLPPDADVRRVKREEHDGVITLIVPRLKAANPFGYQPWR